MNDTPHDHAREDQGEPAEPEQPEPEPAHDRPGIPDMRAALAAAYAALLGDDPDAHEAASGGSCPSCTVLAGISLGFELAATFAGETGLMSQAMRLRLLAAVKATQAELDTGLN